MVSEVLLIITLFVVPIPLFLFAYHLGYNRAIEDMKKIRFRK
jgi:hypothetical protein